MARLFVFVFTRDPNSLGFNSSSHILWGLNFGEAEEVSAIPSAFQEGIAGDFNLPTKTGRALE